MEFLGEAVLPGWAQHVGVAVVPGRVLHLGHQGADRCRVSGRFCDVGAEVQADRIEQPAPGAQVGQQGDRPIGAPAGALADQIQHRPTEGRCRIAQEVLAPEPNWRGPAGRPGRVEVHDVIDLGQVEERHGHLVAERMGRPGAETGVGKHTLVHRTAEAVRVPIGPGGPNWQQVVRHRRGSRCQPVEGVGDGGVTHDGHHVTPMARHVSTALRTPSSWKP